MSAILNAEDLVKRFGKTAAVDGLSFQVEQGSVYGLVGPNGAGKTTLIKVLMNIHTPTAGGAEVLGTQSRHLSAREFAQIGYVSENQDLPDWMTLECLLAYLKPFYPSWDDTRARELVDLFHLPPDRKLKHLSRGMRMKAALASSLAYRPRLLVLDEPFSGLDPLMREELVEGLIESAQETTILVSSHDLAEIESFATHIGFMDNGRLQFSEEMASLSERFREVEVTLDTPPTLPGSWPRHWLRPETSAAVVRFVESSFDQERTFGEVRMLFRGVTGISANPMPLRAIFITLARSSRSTHSSGAAA
jgi:ABC-2 type transport system ATP-binding protein